MKSYLATALGTAMLLGAGPALAVPFSYDEAVDGDLPNIAGAPFALNAGANTVSGSSSFGSPFPSDFDSFAFELDANEVLLTISFAWEVTSVVGMSSAVIFDQALGSEGGFGAPQSQNILLPPSAVPFFASALPLGGGVYSVETLALTNIGNGGAAWDYTWTLTVRDNAAVPEPAALGLFGLGLLGVAGARHRRKASTTK